LSRRPSPIGSTRCFLLDLRRLSIAVLVESAEHASGVVDNFLSSQHAIAVSIQFFRVTTNKAAHGRANAAATVQLGLDELAIIVLVVAAECFFGLTDNLFATDDAVFVEVNFGRVNQNPRLPRTITRRRFLGTSRCSLPFRAIIAVAGQFFTRDLPVVVPIKQSDDLGGSRQFVSIDDSIAIPIEP
jgi:hypothetical protein